MSGDVELVVVDDASEVAAAVAERLAHTAREGGHIALTGGKTPELAYEEAAKREPDWSRSEIWWSDERCVPPDDDLSNFALAKCTLLDRLERGPRAVHRIKGELGKEEAAADYERELDDTKRKAMVRKAEDILEQDPPLIPIAYEQIYDAYYNKVKGQNPSTFFGIYDVVRWDNVWLAQS